MKNLLLSLLFFFTACAVKAQANSAATLNCEVGLLYTFISVIHPSTITSLWVQVKSPWRDKHKPAGGSGLATPVSPGSYIKPLQYKSELNNKKIQQEIFSTKTLANVVTERGTVQGRDLIHALNLFDDQPRLPEVCRPGGDRYTTRIY